MKKASESTLARAAERLAGNRKFMASAVATTNGGTWDKSRLSARLECSVQTAIDLSLCMRPVGTSETFKVDVERIADFVGLPAGNIAALIREAEAIEVLRDRPSKFLAAARDDLSADDSGDKGTK